MWMGYRNGFVTLQEPGVHGILIQKQIIFVSSEV